MRQIDDGGNQRHMALRGGGGAGVASPCLWTVLLYKSTLKDIIRLLNHCYRQIVNFNLHLRTLETHKPQVIDTQRPEVVFADAGSSKRYQREVAAGRMRRIARALYTSNMEDSLDIIVQRNRLDLVDQLFPGSVVSHRSAIEIGGAVQPHLWLSDNYAKERKIEYPGLTIHVLPGKGPLKGDTPIRRFHISGQARAFLENLAPSRGPAERRKTIPRDQLEQRLAETMVSRGEAQLNRLRDEAKELAPQLGLEREATALDSIIGALLGTRPDNAVSDKANIERARSKPYDIDRLKLLERLALQLRDVQTPDSRPVPDLRGNLNVLHTFTFFEAYFSNYIEGTVFEVDEARRVVFDGLKIPLRMDDTHDILNTYLLVVDSFEMSRVATTGKEFLDLLKARHLKILEHRKEKASGMWKESRNRAGDSAFVEPHFVEGTLVRGFELYKSLSTALAKAIFMQILVSEVHPFNDGNGRLSRVMMNAELTRANECRIIIPTVYRDDYIGALKAFTQARETNPLLRMFERAQAFTASMDYQSYEVAKASLTLANAFKEPAEGKLVFAEKTLSTSSNVQKNQGPAD